MLALILLLSALNLSSSAPLAVPNIDSDHAPLTLLGRELPECLNVTRYRTAQDIVWSCLATVFACTWVAVHSNIPGPYDSWWTNMKRRLVTMIYAMLAPEFMAIWAMRQWIGAGEIARKLNSSAQEYCRSGLDIGNKGANPDSQGTVFPCWATIAREIRACFVGPSHNAPLAWTRTHGFFVQMGGFMLCRGRIPIRALGADELLKMVREGKLDVSDYTEDDINDKSKGDLLTKLIVVVQTTWFLFQCLARWASYLPVTELEVVTLAFSVLNVITYALWWKKPQNVLIALRIQLRPGSEDGLHVTRSGISGVNEHTEREVLFTSGQAKEKRTTKELKEVMNNSWDGRDIWGRRHWSMGWLFGVPLRLILVLVHPLMKLSGLEETDHKSLHTPMFSADRGGNRRDLVPLTTIGVLFGAIHLIPWSFLFPSSTEACLWRTSAVIITAEPITLPLVFFTHSILSRYDHYHNSVLLMAIGISALGASLYILARLTLLVLAFTTLRQLPQGALINLEWTSFVPHI